MLPYDNHRGYKTLGMAAFNIGYYHNGRHRIFPSVQALQDYIESHPYKYDKVIPPEAVSYYYPQLSISLLVVIMFVIYLLLNKKQGYIPGTHECPVRYEKYTRILNCGHPLRFVCVEQLCTDTCPLCFVLKASSYKRLEDARQMTDKYFLPF